MLFRSFVPFEPSDFGLVHSSEISFPFLPSPGDGRGLGGVYFFDVVCLRKQGLCISKRELRRKRRQACPRGSIFLFWSASAKQAESTLKLTIKIHTEA